MDVGLVIAGVICIAMAFGHQTIGVVWVLPSLTADRLPGSPFGPPTLTVAMLRVTWYIVTVFVFAIGILLLSLASDGAVDERTFLLHWLGATWIAATAMALWVSREALRDPRQLLRLPVPLLWVVVAVLCLKAAS